MGKIKGKENDNLLCSLETKQGVCYLTVKACSKTLLSKILFETKTGDTFVPYGKTNFITYRNERKGVDVRKSGL